MPSVVAAFGIWRSPLPERWGLRESAAERLLGEPNRQVAHELALELAPRGMSTGGVHIHVLPVAAESGQILCVIADAWEGFDGIMAMAESPDALVAYLISPAESETVTRAAVSRLALDYRDESDTEFGVLTARTGTRDSESEAVMGASLVLTNLHEAAKLKEQGRRDGDPTKMDEAIRRRPEDWTYRVSRAALALQQGDLVTCTQQTDETQAVRDANSVDHLWYASRTASDLEYAESRLRIGGWRVLSSASGCTLLFRRSVPDSASYRGTPATPRAPIGRRPGIIAVREPSLCGGYPRECRERCLMA